MIEPWIENLRNEPDTPDACMCDWAGSECCPVHYNPRDWEEEDYA